MADEGLVLVARASNGGTREAIEHLVEDEGGDENRDATRRSLKSTDGAPSQ